MKLSRDVAAGERLRWRDVGVDSASTAVRFRREMEAAFAPPGEHAPPT
ncbi:MAG TPA: hypothetical protein VNE58_00755 [Casimicrobiaceae bacterium]|nr:hypothetical protein [Casimicrobiaceae bacterium]